MAHIDEDYDQDIRRLSDEIRVSYCNKVIDRAQFVLEKSGRYLSSEAKEQLMEIVSLAKDEITRIES